MDIAEFESLLKELRIHRAMRLSQGEYNTDAKSHLLTLKALEMTMEIVLGLARKRPRKKHDTAA